MMIYARLCVACTQAVGWSKKKNGIRNEVAIFNSPGQGREYPGARASKIQDGDYRTERVFRDETPSNRLQAG